MTTRWWIHLDSQISTFNVDSKLEFLVSWHYLKSFKWTSSTDDKILIFLIKISRDISIKYFFIPEPQSLATAISFFDRVNRRRKKLLKTFTIHLWFHNFFFMPCIKCSNFLQQQQQPSDDNTIMSSHNSFHIFLGTFSAIISSWTRSLFFLVFYLKKVLVATRWYLNTTKNPFLNHDGTCSPVIFLFFSSLSGYPVHSACTHTHTQRGNRDRWTNC